MTTGKHGRCPWMGLAASRLAAGLGVAFAATTWAWAAPPARASAVALPSEGTAQDETLYLEVVRNHVPLRRIAPFVLRGGRMHAEAHVLESLGLTWPGMQASAGLVALDSLPGLRSAYDVASQRLDILVPVELISGPVNVIGYEAPPSPRLDPATRAPGLLLNYDLYAQGDRDARSLGGWNEARVFGWGPGVWRSSSVQQVSGGRYGNESRRSTRLDTSWQLDFPDRMVSVMLGDALSGSLSWTRALRFGGLRISSNFQLQPYRVTVPLASFVGEAAVPSAVDLFINGIREAQGNVAPGRFQVIGAPVFNGAGSAQMVMTDITGQTRVVHFSLYNSARLLQQGLSDWSVELGHPRRNYGLRSAAYADDAMASGSVRYGLSNSMTLEAHGESTEGLAMGGLGALWLLGRTGGVVSAAYGSSRQGAIRGQQRGAGYEWQGEWLSLNASTQRRDDAFRDVASLAGSALPGRTDQAFVGLNVGHGQLGASYVRQDYKSAPRSRYAGLSWSQSLGGYGNFSISVNRDMEGHNGTHAYVYWSLPLGHRHHAWGRTEHLPRGATATVGATRALPGDSDGWGWRVQTSAGEDAGAQAEISQLTRYGQWRAGTQHWRSQGVGSSMGYAGASGGLLWMQGGLFPMRRVHDAFALVSTDGIAEVPVLLENRLIGATDARGLLLVTPLNAWADNDLSIDPLVLAEDVSVQRVRLAAVPATGSGMLARFPMKAVVVVELALRSGDGDWIAAGTSVTIEPAGPQATATVGYDGRLYLQDPPKGAQLTVPLDVGQCKVSLPDLLPERGRLDLGVLSCRY